jgi:hypothetical protein
MKLATSCTSYGRFRQQFSGVLQPRLVRSHGEIDVTRRQQPGHTCGAMVSDLDLGQPLADSQRVRCENSSRLLRDRIRPAVTLPTPYGCLLFTCVQVL